MLLYWSEGVRSRLKKNLAETNFDAETEEERCPRFCHVANSCLKKRNAKFVWGTWYYLKLSIDYLGLRDIKPRCNLSDPHGNIPQPSLLFIIHWLLQLFVLIKVKFLHNRIRWFSALWHFRRESWILIYGLSMPPLKLLSSTSKPCSMLI